MVRVRKPVRRGASSRRRAPRIRLPGVLLLAGALAILGFGALGGLAYGGWQLAKTVAAVPVARVVFSGELQYVAREELIAQVEPQLVDEGFFTIRLDALRTAVEALPWVERAAVIRHWPNELEMVVYEQQPVAHWGEQALLNRHGEIFHPRQAVQIEGLPKLGGPDTAVGEVVAQYEALTSLLAGHSLKLSGLVVDERGSWMAHLEGGATLNLGTEQLLRRAERFLRAYRSELAGRFEQVSYVDLRYANGLAVGWKVAEEQRS